MEVAAHTAFSFARLNALLQISSLPLVLGKTSKCPMLEAHRRPARMLDVQRWCQIMSSDCGVSYKARLDSGEPQFMKSGALSYCWGTHPSAPC